MGLFKKISSGLKKTREGVIKQVDSMLSSFTKIDQELFDELEEILVSGDVGIYTAEKICSQLKERVKSQKETRPEKIKDMLKEIIEEMLSKDIVLKLNTKPSAILVIGVNGVGKTTTIGKLAHNLKVQGKKVILGAADTFRDAAIEQIAVWGERAGCDVIKHSQGSDPAAVVYDTISAAKSRGADVLICDTAGRLHNKKNLMNELAKINRIIERELPNADIEVLLVLDAVTGQNALNQAKAFSESTNITGIVLTKLDGTAKGGIVLAISQELSIPIKYIGVGEQIDDLQPFDAKSFANALFGEE